MEASFSRAGDAPASVYTELMRCVVNGDEDRAIATLSERPESVFETDAKGYGTCLTLRFMHYADGQLYHCVCFIYDTMYSRTALDWARIRRSQRFVQLIMPVVEVRMLKL